MTAMTIGGAASIQELNLVEMDLVGGGVDSADLETLSLAAGALAAGASVTPLPGARVVAAGAAVVAIGSYLAAQIMD